MCDEQPKLFRQPPRLLRVEEVARALNFQSYEILNLVILRLLKPEGNPAPNATKLSLTTGILGLAQDKTKLTKTTNALYQHRATKNHFSKIQANGNAASWPEPANAATS